MAHRFEEWTGHIQEHAARMCELAIEHGEVTSEFNGIELVATRGDEPAAIVANYSRICEERHAAYIASPEYAERCRQDAERERKRSEDLQTALATAPASLTLRHPQFWIDGLAKNTNGYGAAVYRYADTWARVMEGMIATGQSVSSCANYASCMADTEGITGFMYGCAVSILAACWIHGEELRRWHNLDTQIGDEGERANENGGVLNPALLSIGGAMTHTPLELALVHALIEMLDAHLEIRTPEMVVARHTAHEALAMFRGETAVVVPPPFERGAHR